MLRGNLTIWPTVLDWCLFGRVISTIALGHYSVPIGNQREQNYTEIVQACFLNHTFTFCATGLIDKSCMWTTKKLQYNISATSSSYYINSEYFRSCRNVEKFTLLITPEDKSNKQQNQGTHSFSWQPNQTFFTDLIFCSQHIGGDKKHVTVVTRCALSVVLSIKKCC